MTRPRTARWATATGAALLLGLAPPALAQPLDQTDDTNPTAHPAQLEALDRGLVAVPTSEGIHLSWRLLGTEVTGSTESGMEGADFAVYRGNQQLAVVTDSTNFLDPDGDARSRYRVAPVVDGKEGKKSSWVQPWAEEHGEIPLLRPADGVTPAGEAYTYSASDMSVADLDGDGSYEYVVKWDPSNAKDVSQVGYTGNTYLDAYEMDGRLLWRIDLGVNIRSGAHYTQFPVYDFDGDGRAELMVKTAPGTRSVRLDSRGREISERFVQIPADDRAAGVTNSDDYRLSAEDYAERLQGVLAGWSERPEVVSGEWPATLEEAWGIEPRWDYPLSEADAQEATDYFIDVYAPGRSSRNQLRAFEGFVLDGPEYLTVFDGRTGLPLETVDYQPGRGDDGLLWGDYAYSRIEPGNRVDRFLAGVGHFEDGRPSALFARGYYTRTTLAAYDWDGKELTTRWTVDSGHVPLSNPFNDGPHGRDGTDPVYGSITTQGFHSLSVADVDDDGRHEVVYGSATLDDDGSLLYSSTATLPPGSANPGAEAKLGHGDAMHVSDLDPARPGLEIWTVHEGGASAPYGSAMRDAATGEVLFGAYSGRDTGRGMVGDVRPDVTGIEVWASMPGGSDGSGLLDVRGEQLETRTPGTNQSVRWAADGTTQLINGSGNATPTIDDWTRGTLRTLTGTLTNNGTKGNPSLVADVLGDWREEVLVRSADSSAIHVYTSTELTDRKMYTLMHDAQYRAEVARQQTSYNQPSYPGFYLASDTDWSTVPLPNPLER